MNADDAKRQRHVALARLKDRRLFREFAYVGGAWTASGHGATIDVTNPADGAWLGSVASLSSAEAGEAVDAASKAFPAWAGALPQDRSRILRRWFELVIEHREDLALIMTLEQGKPISEARGEIDYAASFVEFYAEEAKRPNIESVTSHLRRCRGRGLARAGGRRGTDHAVELPDRDDHAQGRRCACRRLHGRRASLARDAVFGAGAGRTGRTARASRRACSTS